MKSLKILLCGLLVFAPLRASATDRFNVGTDFVLPYVLSLNGDNFTERGNTAIGVQGQYSVTESFRTGLRTEFDIDSRNGLKKQVAMAPGLQYRWLPEERFNPYFRFDLPVYLKSNQDIGAAVGFGVNWNLGGAIGLPGMTVRYDFSLEYDTGIGDALSALQLDMLKFGVEYQF